MDLTPISAGSSITQTPNRTAEEYFQLVHAYDHERRAIVIRGNIFNARRFEDAKYCIEDLFKSTLVYIRNVLQEAAANDDIGVVIPCDDGEALVYNPKRQQREHHTNLRAYQDHTITFKRMMT